MKQATTRAIVFILGCALTQTLAFTVASALELGPVNPKLIEWLSKHEISEDKRFGHIPDPIDWSHLQACVSKFVLPEYFDLRDSGGVTPVKNQSTCGACWAFSTCASLESWLAHNGAGIFDLSENHMKNTHGFSIDHCDGGNNQISTAYLARFTGPLAETDDPYNPNQVVPPLPGAQPQKLLRWAPIFGGCGISAQRAIMEYGAVTGAMIWRDSAYDPASHIYYDYGVGGPGGGHMITVVGWDNNKVVPNAPTSGAFICKNSWGAHWGENGYFYLSYHSVGALDEIVGFFDLVDPSTYGTVYQHDFYGLTGHMGVPGPVIYGANVFVASQNGRLAAVGTYALQSCVTHYTIRVYNSGYAGGFSNLAASVSGTVENAGYYVVDLPGNVNLTAGQAFSVVIRFETPGWDYPLPLEAPIAGYSPATAGLGQSYVSQDGNTWSDLHGLGGSFANCNICIKAITAPSAPDPEGEGEPPAALVRIIGRTRVTVGSPLTLRLMTPPLVGHVQYAWHKDGRVLPHATTSELHWFGVTLEDSGVYKAYVTDESKAIYESEPFVLQVLAEGSLPVSSLAAMLFLALMLAVLAVWAMRRHAFCR